MLLNLEIDFSNSTSLTFLVDTGADVSLVRIQSLKGSTMVSQRTRFVLTGITSNSITTLGICTGNIAFPLAQTVNHEFSVVPEHFQLNSDSDGIIGRDFLLKHDAIINYPKGIVYLKVAGREVEIPFKSDQTRQASGQAQENSKESTEVIPNQANKNPNKSDINLKNKQNQQIIHTLSDPLNEIDSAQINFPPKVEKSKSTKVLPNHEKENSSTSTIITKNNHNQQTLNTFIDHTNKVEPIHIILPPRVEKYFEIPVPQNQNMICLSEEIIPGVFVGNFLICSQTEKAMVSIVNSNEHEIELYYKPKLEYLSHFNILNLKTQAAKPNTVQHRIDQITQSIHLPSDLNPEEKSSILKICSEFHDLYHLEGDKLTHTDVIQHKIPLKTDTNPINIRPYRLPESQKIIIEGHVNEMLQNDIIQHSSSPWNSPLLVVPKKPDQHGNKQWRVVVDYRKLNNVTIGDAFPLPNITEILEQTGYSRYFSTLDLASGYHQITMDPVDCEKTAFSTPNGHYEFKKMPFGLKGAPATFVRAMTKILTGLQNTKCLVYLDDIIIFGRNLQDHNNKLTEVFKCLRKHNLKIQPNKCHFLHREIMFLGHIISQAGIMPDPSKIEAVKNYPRPTNVKEIQTFLGFTNYYRKFIKNFSDIVSPFTQLLKKNVPFVWSQECEKSFILLKDKLTTAPILQHPNFNKEFLLTADASDKAIGAILSQGEIGKDLPISYASRTLNSAEQNYSVTEKELLAVVWGTHTFRPYLFGRKFQIISDHQPLIWGLKVKDPSSRLLRWRIKLEEYDFDINYKPGKSNTNADALSRISYKQCLAITRAQANKENTLPEAQTHFSNTVETITDPETINSILKEFHDAPLGGHQGVIRSFKRIKQRYKWKNMMKDIVTYIKKCPKCQKNKYGKNTKIPMKITTTSSIPFEKIFLDICGPLPISDNNNRYILTMQDDLSKYSLALPMENAEANTVAKIFVTELICRHGTPQSILTDQGSNFLSSIFKNVCKLLKIKQLQTTAYRPQTNGALERSHRTLGEVLRNYTDQDQRNWDLWLPYAMFVYNSTPHSTTKMTPFKILYGYEPTLPSSIKCTPNPVYTYDDYVQELKARLQSSYAIARENILKSKQSSKLQYDKNAQEAYFKIGDLVLLKDNTSRRKLSELYHGPYEIVEINSAQNSTIKINKKLKMVHNNNLKPFNT